jgi:hypothetical protein
MSLCNSVGLPYLAVISNSIIARDMGCDSVVEDDPK